MFSFFNTGSYDNMNIEEDTDSNIPKTIFDISDKINNKKIIIIGIFDILNIWHIRYIKNILKEYNINIKKNNE